MNRLAVAALAACLSLGLNSANAAEANIAMETRLTPNTKPDTKLKISLTI